MSVEAACPCGARFRAAPHLYGKEVNCPSCGQKFKIPSPQPAPTKKMTVQCACGAKYQVAATMVGKRVQCQACKQAFVVGQAPSAPAAPAAAGGNPLGGAAPDPFGAATSDPFGGSAPDPFGGSAPDPLAGLSSDPLAGGSLGFPGMQQPVAGASPFGAPGAAPGFGASPFGAAAPVGPAYQPAPAQRAKSGGGGKLVLLIVGISAVVVVGLVAVGVGGWFAWGLLMGGYSTPQSVFYAAQEARKNKDYETMFTTLTPDSQNQLAGFLACMAVLGRQREAGLTEILTKHGINPDDFQSKYNVSASNPLSLLSLNTENFKKMSVEVSNKAGLFGDVARLSDERRAAQGKAGPMNLPGVSSDDLATLEDVVIDGDRATGKAKSTLSGKPTESNVKFRRVNGRWYLDIEDDMRPPSGRRSP